MKFSPTVDLGTFLANLHMCTFSIQMSEFYILVVLEWKHDDFLRFENFSKNKKNWSFHPPRTCLALLTPVYIFYPNEWIFIF